MTSQLRCAWPCRGSGGGALASTRIARWVGVVAACIGLAAPVLAAPDAQAILAASDAVRNPSKSFAVKDFISFRYSSLGMPSAF